MEEHLYRTPGRDPFSRSPGAARDGLIREATTCSEASLDVRTERPLLDAVGGREDRAANVAPSIGVLGTRGGDREDPAPPDEPYAEMPGTPKVLPVAIQDTTYDPLDDVPASVRQRLAQDRLAQSLTSARQKEKSGEIANVEIAQVGERTEGRGGLMCAPPATSGRRERPRARLPRNRHEGYDVRSRETRGRSRKRTLDNAIGKANQERLGSCFGGESETEIMSMTWNAGGMPMDRLAEMIDLLPELGLGRVGILAMQEVSCPPGMVDRTTGQGKVKWRIVAGKKETEWRGRMIAVKESVGKILHKELAQDALGVTVKTNQGKVGVLNVHLPPKATMADTGQRMENWSSSHALRQPNKILLGDLNETFVQATVGREAWSTLQRKTARGAMLLQWLGEHDMYPPSQDLAQPTYFPYNQLHRPRRLDYIFYAGIKESSPGGVHPLRHLASSDHDAVAARLKLATNPRGQARRRPGEAHGAKQLGAEEIVDARIKDSRQWKGDKVRELQQLAASITQPRRNPFRYVESREIKQLRARAMSHRRTPEARALWKEVWKRKKQHKDQWHRDLLQEVLRNNWHALHAVKRARKTTMWAGNLTSEEGWQKRMRTHFESIFKQQAGEAVRKQVQAIWKRLEVACKYTAWQPFSFQELAGVMKTWKGGKTTGPDGVSFEALKAIHKDDRWKGIILEEFNDALYKGRLPPTTKQSLTILIPKEACPGKWSETRPITLSSSCLKWQSQLLLTRTTKHILQGATWQYAQPEKQPAELILSIRKAVRTCREWGLPLHLVKVDVAKAFDTVLQTQLAALVESQVGQRGGRPWEARLWIDLLTNDEIRVHFDGDTHEVQQTNGVRQGAPDSPVIFAAMIGQILNEVLGSPPRSANPTPPTPQTFGDRTGSTHSRTQQDRAPDCGPPMPSNGGGFQDDIYLWSHDKGFLQAKLQTMVASLRARNLQVNATKTKYVHSQGEEEQTIQVGDKEVVGERDGTITVLGAPIALSGEATQILAEVARRARAAFAVHKNLLTGASSLDHKLLAYTRYVATSALWAIGAAHPHESLLKGVNSIQLMQLRQVFGIRRRTLEKWNQRSLRQARVHLAARPSHRWSTVALTQVWRLWGHTARHGRDTGLMLGWRNQEWWRAEQSKARGLRHPSRFNAMLETEKLLEKVVTPWKPAALDRQRWKQLEPTFVKNSDPPWSSGKQTSLDNLAPN